MSDKLLATAEAAKALGISRTTLARWRREGLIEPAFVTMGGQARWDLDDLRRQITERGEQSE